MNDKINYHDYFLTMCYLVAMRSIDPNTKCGAVLVSRDKKVLSTGYNGPIKGVDDTKIPLVRPDKYFHLLHGEENCLLAYNGSDQDLVGATMYVTGAPCNKCLRMIIQKGIKHIVYTKGNFTKMHDEEVARHCRMMYDYCPDVKVEIIDNLHSIVNLLAVTTDYIKTKNPEQFS